MSEAPAEPHVAIRPGSVMARPLAGFLLRRILARAVRRGKITATEGERILTEAGTRDFQSFLEWLLENYPAIIEMMLAFMEIFMLFA